jgi:hypothetical protein
MTKERAKKVTLTPAQEAILAKAQAERELDESRYYHASEMVRSCVRAHETLLALRQIRNALWPDMVSCDWGPDSDMPQELREAVTIYTTTNKQMVDAIRVMEKWLTKRFTSNGYGDSEAPSVYLGLLYAYKERLIATDWQPKPRAEAAA